MIRVVYVRRRQRPWFRILRDLMAAGVSMHEVARACGKRSVTTVAHWAEGGDPKDADARVVLELYRRYCSAQYEKHMQEFEPARSEREVGTFQWSQAQGFDLFAPPLQAPSAAAQRGKGARVDA